MDYRLQNFMDIHNTQPQSWFDIFLFFFFFSNFYIVMLLLLINVEKKNNWSDFIYVTRRLIFMYPIWETKKISIDYRQFNWNEKKTEQNKSLEKYIISRSDCLGNSNFGKFVCSYCYCLSSSRFIYLFFFLFRLLIKWFIV